MLLMLNISEIDHILFFLGKGFNVISVVILVLDELFVLSNVVIHMS